MKNKIIYIFCGLDLHKPIIENCINKLLQSRDDVDVGVATFGNANLPPSEQLSKMCQKMDIPFYVSRSVHINADVDCCELTGMFEVSTHFYENYDYSMVILMHPDTVSVRNYNNSIEEHLEDDYCLIVPLINLEPNIPLEDEKIFIDMTGHGIAGTRFRVTQAVLSFGRNFCLHMKEKYGTIENIWNQVLKKFIKYGDCSMINFYPKYEGYDTHLLYGKKQIVSQQSFGAHKAQNLNYVDYVLKNKNLNFIHIGHPPGGWRCPPGIPGSSSRERYVNWVFEITQDIIEKEKENNNS